MTLSWYVWVLVITLCIFAVKTILYWIGGDTDLDLDFDGETDIDVSGMLSFKGILHFIMGFSAVLTSISYEKTHSLSETVQFTFLNYVWAIVIGFLFMGFLFYLYKFMMKLNHYNQSQPSFNDCTAKVYLVDNVNKEYDVLISTPQGTFKKTLKPFENEKEYHVGEYVTVKYVEEEKKYYIV